MKKALFIFASSVLLFSCSGPSETDYTPISDSINVVGLENKTQRVTPSSFIKSPFIDFFTKSGTWKSHSELEANLHDKTKKDTIITLRYKESLVHIHNQDLVDAYIVNNEVNLPENIHVGMQKDSFLSIFDQLKNHNDDPFVEILPESIKIGCCSEQNDMWTFLFDADTIYEIDYNGYID